MKPSRTPPEAWSPSYSTYLKVLVFWDILLRKFEIFNLVDVKISVFFSQNFMLQIEAARAKRVRIPSSATLCVNLVTGGVETEIPKLRRANDI